jgi:hypothetical protein
MAKWADYLISKVSYDSNHLILKIKQHTDNGKTISQGDIVDRDTLANNLGHGAKYRTLYNSLEKVRIGENVRYFRAYEHHYIRIDKNKVTTDNLGDLPNLEEPNHVEKPALPQTQPEPTAETKPLSATSSAFFAEPVEETVEPVEETVEPVEETVEPVEETVEPVEETVEPVEEKPKETKKRLITKRKAPAKKRKAPAKKRKAPAKKRKAPAKKRKAPAKKRKAPAKKRKR